MTLVIIQVILIPPRRTSSHFSCASGFQTDVQVQTCAVFNVQLDKYVVWSYFSFSKYGHYARCKPHSTNLSKVEKDSTQGSFKWPGFTTAVKPSAYGTTLVFSLAFQMMALQFLLVRFGSSHLRSSSWCKGVDIVIFNVGGLTCKNSDMNIMNQWQQKLGACDNQGSASPSSNLFQLFPP